MGDAMSDVKSAGSSAACGNELAGERTVVKGLSFNGVTQDGNTVQVDVKDGKIVRIRPFHFDWKYDRKPWRMEARGKVFEASMKTLIPPFTLGLQEPRQLTQPRPCTRSSGWTGTPTGERNPQNRGKSKYVRISWDEATDLIAVGDPAHREGVRTVRRPAAAGRARRDARSCTPPTAATARLMSLLGGYTLQTRNPDSWEGWYWGAKHVWGMRAGRQGRLPVQHHPGHRRAHQTCCIFAGCDPETTTWGWGGQTVSQLCYWFTELGIKQVYICPDVNWGAAVHADKWIPIRPNTDAALYLAHRLPVAAGGHLRQGVRRHPRGGLRQVRGLRPGRRRRHPQDPQVGRGEDRRSRRASSRPWPGPGPAPPPSTVHGNGGNMSRGPYATENMRHGGLSARHAGPGQAGPPHVDHHRVGPHGSPDGPPSSAFGESVPVPRHLHLSRDVERGQPRRRPAVGDLPAQFIPKDMIHEAINEATPEKPITWYGTTQSRAAHRRPVREVPVSGRGLLGGPHDLDRHAVADDLLERRATTSPRPSRTPRSSSSWPSIRGSRTTASSPTSSCR